MSHTKSPSIIEILDEAGSRQAFRVTANGERQYLARYSVGLLAAVRHAYTLQAQYVIAIEKRSGTLGNGKPWYATVYDRGIGPVGGFQGSSIVSVQQQAVADIQRQEGLLRRWEA